MRIAMRTGGGRGDYELAGTQGEINASSLFNRQILYEITPQLTIPGRSFACLRNGKPRIRLDEGTRSRTTHFYGLIASILLLPKPKRELKTTVDPGELVRKNSYCITAIPVDVSKIDESFVILRPTAILLENAIHMRESISFLDRFARVTAIWNAAELQDSPLSALVRHHRQLIFHPNPDYHEIESAAQAISDLLETDVDPISDIENRMGLVPEPSDAHPVFHPADESDFGEVNTSSPFEARLQNVKQWREVASRGAAAAQFRRDVTRSYDFRCLFSGQRLPKTEATLSAGVDAAHILPWSTHGINDTRNGVCLTKQCHWALDAGLLKFYYNNSIEKYVLEIPRRVSIAAIRADFDIAFFESLTGPLPDERLPEDRGLWPSPDYLRQFNDIVFADA